MIPKNYALLIGVEDYSDFDRSEGRVPGTSNVAGAVQDARAWFRQCIAWGFAPERIRVLTAPALKPQDLGPEATTATVGDATSASLLEGVRWLAEGIEGSEPSAGLVTFSGHGEQARGVLLCPSDMTAADQRLVHLRELRKIVGGGPLAGSLTMILDCCRGEAGPQVRSDVRPRLRVWGRRARGPFPSGPGDGRVLAACEPNATSRSSVFGGVTMGAFTWALTSALGQWRVVKDGDVLRLDASYGELLHRCRVLLRALSFEQIPVLQGAPAVDRLPFLEPLGRGPRGRTQNEPTCRRGRRQLDPSEKDFRVYLLRYLDQAGYDHVAAKVIVTSTAGAVETSAGSFDLRGEDEYWFVSSAVLKQLAAETGGTLTLSVEGDYDYDVNDPAAAWRGDVAGAELVQCTPAPATWRSAVGWLQGAQVFETADQSIALALLLQDDPQGGSLGFRRIDWYQTGSEPLFHADASVTYGLHRRGDSARMNPRYSQAISDFELFSDLA